MDDDHKGTTEAADQADRRPNERIDAPAFDGVSEETPQVYRVARPGSRRSFLQSLAAGGAISGATLSDSCSKDTPGGPTNTTTTSSSTTSSTVPTTTIAPTFTLFGVVNDRSGRPVGGARVFVIDGPNANKASMTDGNGYYSIAGLVQSSFTLRTTINGIFVFDLAITITRDTRQDFSVTTTTTTTSSTTSTQSSVPVTSPTTIPGGPCACDLVHYWYPN